jgi:exopolyphosphatase / guanosine-5'-triphosphate,3'-diphosphate pyrophosphatase
MLSPISVPKTCRDPVAKGLLALFSTHQSKSIDSAVVEKTLFQTAPQSKAAPDVWAALDLGSNNFQMLIVQRIRDELFVIDRLKDKVQLLQGFTTNSLQPTAIARGLEVLGRYRQRLQEVPPEKLKVVGTFALRVAGNRSEFLVPAERLLGVSVDVLSGVEEAKLIDLAVSRHLDDALERSAPGSERLVIDIGGGSTELALSEWQSGQRRLTDTNSLPLGCVALMDQYFSHAEVIGRAYPLARMHALSELRASGAKSAEAADVVGTSGTLESILTVCEANGFCRGEVTAEALRRVENAITGGMWIADFGMPGLPPERIDIFPAGVAILSALMEVLNIDRVRFCDATLPHGVLYAGMGLAADSCSALDAVRALAIRFGVDLTQGNRVAKQALKLFQCLRDDGVDERHAQLLQYAANLAEIGLRIGVQGYHRHGAYLLQHSQIRGLTQGAQEALVTLVRCHRRAWPAGLQSEGERLGYPRLKDVLMCLRLAVILERSHSDSHSPQDVDLVFDGNVFVGQELALKLPMGWLPAHPLTATELDQEQQFLAREGILFSVA